jgi:hypothetical protein
MSQLSSFLNDIVEVLDKIMYGTRFSSNTLVPITIKLIKML